MDAAIGDGAAPGGGQAGTLAISGWTLPLKPASAVRDVAIFDAVADPGARRGARIDAVLEAAYALPTCEVPSRRLGMIDRQAALFRLALHHGYWPAWFVAGCEACGSLADLRVAAADFSYQPAATGYPWFTVETDDGESFAFLAPNGSHEALIEDATAPMTLLIRATCVSDATPPADDPAFVARYEDALAAVCPKFPTALPFACPVCGGANAFWFDPLDWIARFAGAALQEVHVLASAYGWDEAAILGMSPTRRRAYIAMQTGAA
jgi:hypothetical protein